METKMILEVPQSFMQEALSFFLSQEFFKREVEVTEVSTTNINTFKVTFNCKKSGNKPTDPYTKIYKEVE